MSYENTGLRCQPREHLAHLREHAERGQCRRHAPPPVSTEQERAIVKKTDWCGEHSHVEF